MINSKENKSEKIDGYLSNDKDSCVKRMLRGKPFTLVKKENGTSLIHIEGVLYSCFNSQMILN